MKPIKEDSWIIIKNQKVENTIPINKPIQINIKMSKTTKVEKNHYTLKDIVNTYTYVIVVSLLTIIGITLDNSYLPKLIDAQITNNVIQNNNNNPNIQTNSPTGNNFIVSGPLSSFLSTPTGNWVVNGSWVMTVQNGKLSFFNADMLWDPTNLNKTSHTHNFVNFRADPNTQNIVLGPDRVLDIKGVMDIGANNQIQWVDVPAEIKTTKNTIEITVLDDAKTGNHFNNYPIFGKLEKVSPVTLVSNSVQPPPSITPPPIQTTLPPHQSIKSFKLNGIIDSVTFTPSGSKWNTDGKWTLVVDDGKVALFDIGTTWKNDTSSHTHDFLNFKPKTKSITLKPDNTLTLKGVMDIGTNNQTSWISVPASINIDSGKTITISVDDKKTNHHFVDQPIRGIINKLTLCSNIPSENMEILPRCT